MRKNKKTICKFYRLCTNFTFIHWNRSTKNHAGKAFLGKHKTPDPSFIFATSDRYDEKVDRLRAIRYGNYKYIRNFNPTISNAIDVSYREQMPMMKNMRDLWESNKLSKNIAQWFSTPKPEEELYDISNDPYELKNLAKNRELIDTLFFLRNKLDGGLRKQEIWVFYLKKKF